MKIPIAKCDCCRGFFSLGYDRACPDCYIDPETGKERMASWEHLYWIEEGNLFVWDSLDI